MIKRPVSIILAMLLSASVAIAGGVYTSSAHGHPNTGVHRDTALPRGNCAQCHGQHDTPGNSFGLFMENFGGSKNGLCFSCHASSSAAYFGQGPYQGAVHSTSSFAYWPGPTPSGRVSSDFGNCANCHDPHGSSDANGLIPSLLVARDESLCLACHDSGGPSMVDIGRQTAKLNNHAMTNVTMLGKHSAAELMIPASFSGTNRHIECSDCHNVHAIQSTTVHTVGTNVASDLLKGVSRLEAVYGGSAWTPPSFTPRAGNYVTDIRYEYELCFKCHSSWAYSSLPPSAPSGGNETDQSVEFNPNNRSYHPVVDYIKDNSYTIPTVTNGFTQTMESPWDADPDHKLMYCSDCHTSETNGDPTGPHGSTKPYVLVASTSTSDNTFCLKCHKTSVYAPSEPGTSETGSRFDMQTTGDETASHFKHVVDKHIGCRQCHGGSRVSNGGSISPGSAHGTDLSAGFMNGTQMISYSPGNCLPACHERETYTAGTE